MKIETVTGSISPDKLGITLSHEHLLADFTVWLQEIKEASRRKIKDEKITLECLSDLRRTPSIMKDNLILSNPEFAIEELKDYKIRGGVSLIELTLPGVGRDILGLKKISKYSDVQVIAPTGWYIGASHPNFVKERDYEELSQIIVKELEEGIDDTEIKAGIIGEIGCSYPLQSSEVKVLKAASRAQCETGTCINIHPATSWQNIGQNGEKTQVKDGIYYLECIEKEGGNIEKAIMGHMDAYNNETIPLLGLNMDYHREILEKGATIEYDWFGRYLSYRKDVFPGATSPTDRERIVAIVRLCEEGYSKQLVISQDVHMKIHLKKFGGQGYSYILEYIVPALKYAGVSDKQLRNILIDNPKRLLSF